MSRIAPHSGHFRLFLTPTGNVVAPDLIASMMPIVRPLGNGHELPSVARIACPVEEPALVRARQPVTSHPRSNLQCLATTELWRIHNIALDGAIQSNCPQGASLLDVKTEIGRRMLQRCHLCHRHCKADRNAGQTGFCELTNGLMSPATRCFITKDPSWDSRRSACFLRAVHCDVVFVTDFKIGIRASINNRPLSKLLRYLTRRQMPVPNPGISSVATPTSPSSWY